MVCDRVVRLSVTTVKIEGKLVVQITLTCPCCLTRYHGIFKSVKEEDTKVSSSEEEEKDDKES